MSKRKERREHYVNVVRPSRGRWMMEYECPIDGEELFLWFMPALRQWLVNRAAIRPSCVVCGRHNVVDGQRPPQAFLLVEVDAAAERPPRQVLFLDICDHCAARDNDELRKVGLRRLWGRASVPRQIGDDDGTFVEFVLGGSRFTFDDSSVHGDGPPMTGGAPQHGRDIGGKPELDDGSSDDK
jgi:hypothetical protein